MLNDANEDPGSSNSKSLSWDEFFNEMDQKFTTTEENVQIAVENQEFFPNVATLPHKKAVCYGICTVSEQPKLVKCEDCGQIIKLVGFGHHRKVRHHDHPLVDEQSDNSAQSDSEDDCQGFLLSPPHHCMAMPSTSESSNMESDESIRPVESNSSLPVTPVKINSSLSFAQQKPLYNIEKRNGLQIVLKRTPVKIVPETGFEQQKSQNPNEPQQRPAQQAKKIKKKPIVHVFGSKKKRKGGKKKVAQPAMEVSKNESNEILLEQQQPKHQLQAGAQHHPTTFLQEQYNNFIRREQIHSSTASRNSSSLERPISQEPTSSPFPNWDPRDAAQRPVIGKASGGGGIGSSKPVGKVLPTLLYRRPAVATTISSSAVSAPHRTMQMPTTATSTGLKRVAGPSILKYTPTTSMPNATDKPQQSHQQPRQPVARMSDTVFEQILKYPGISVTLKPGSTGSATNTANTIRKVMPTSSNQLHHHVVPHQNQSIQQQLAAMQHQQQKRRMMTRDFDAAKRDFEVTVNSRKSNNEEVRTESKPKPADNSAPASPDDSLANEANIEEKAKIEEVQQKQPKPIPLMQQQDQAVQQEGKAQSKTTAPVQPFLRRFAEKDEAADSGRNISPSSSGITWRRLAESPQLPGERKASSSGTSVPLRSPIITVGSTRFIPVDPRGLNKLRKNASSGNLLPQSATNSKSNSPATSSPMHSSNPQSSMNEKQQHAKEEQQPNSTGTSSASNTGIVSSASSTTSASSSPSNRQQQQHIEVVINNRKRPLDQQKQHMIIPMAKRYRPMLPKTAAGGSQQIGRFGMVSSTDPSDQAGSSAVNIDAFSSMQPQQPQFSIIAPNSFPLGTNVVTINSQKLHQHYQQQQPQNRLQPQVKHQRYPSSTQELGQVFTIVQHQQQQQQQYRQQHVLQQPQTHQQLRYHSNGRTISVNAPHLLKVTPSGLPMQQQQFHGGPSSSSMYQQQQGIFPMGSPPPYEGGERIYAHQHYQVAPPDPAWEFVIGSSSPPNDYFGMQQQQHTMVSSSPYHNPHQLVQQQAYQTPYKTNMPMGYAQPQHPYAASGSQPAPMLPIQHQPQQQFNAVGVRGYVTTTVNRLQPQQQQQTPAFLEPSPTYGGAVDFGGQMQGGGIKIYGNRMPTQPHGSNVLMGTIIADSSGIDPPPVLEAEGRFPAFSSPTEQPTTSIRTRSAPTVEAAPNDEERSTSSGASDLDLREVLQQQGNTVTAASVQAQLNRQLKMRPT